MAEQWIEEYMKLLAKHEGTRGGKAIEGGGYTRGYGLTTLAQNFVDEISKTKGVNADELSDKELAKEYVIWNAKQIEKKFPNYSEWPKSVKMSAVDLAYNGGNISAFKGFSSALSAGNYEEAAKQTLDIVSASDPQTGESGVLRGLANRRVDFYNMVANEVGFSPIKDFSITRSGAEGKKTNINYDKGDTVIEFDFRGALHSASGDYDSVKKKKFSQPTAEDIRRETSPFMEENRRYNQRLTGDVVLPDDFDTQTATEEVAQPPVEEVTAPESVPEEDVISEPEPTANAPAFPMPEEGSFEAIFSVDRYGATAEESFAVPDDFVPTEEAQQISNAERAFQIDAGLVIDQVPKPNPNIKVDRTKPEEGVIESQPQFNFIGKERYGTPVGSTLESDSEYDYDMFTPTNTQALKAAFRQYNIIPALSRLGAAYMTGRRRDVPGYSVYNDHRLKSLVGEDGLYFFRHSGSHTEAMDRYNNLNSDYQDMKTIERSQSGAAFSVVAGVTDPTIAAPIFPKFLSGADRLRRFGRGFVSGYVPTAGVQAIIEANNESRDAHLAAYSAFAAGILGGAIGMYVGKSMSPAALAEMKLNQDNLRVNFLGGTSQYTAEEITELKKVASAGASISPELARTNAYRQLEMEALEQTGIGIEKLGWNPVQRMFQSKNAIVRQLAPEMVDVGGLMQKKVRQQGEAMAQSVETTFRTTYYPDLLEAITKSDLAYMAYRNVQAASGPAKRALQMTKMRFTDKIDDLLKRHDGSLSEVQFRNRVGMAMRRGDADSIEDAATPFVNQAAQEYRKVFNKIKDEANSVRLFERELADDIARARAANNQALVSTLTEKLQRLRDEGVTVNTALSYVPRIYRIDKIEQNIPRFLGIVKNWAMTSQRMSATQADQFAAQILDTVTRRRPFIDYEHATDALDWIKNPSGVQARSLEIPDDLIEEFLENDIESLLRSHTRTMGMDIELTKKFGSSSMDDLIKQVEDEYQRLIGETADYQLRSELAQGLKNDLRDIRGLRDRLRGTYGASKDPHALSSRFVRVMKSFNVLTGMGSAMISSIPDIARIAMVEGFTNAYGKGFAAVFDEQARIIRTMSKKELEKAAVAVDATLGLRAHAMSDIGDLFGNRYAIERSLNDATGMFFLMNGLNIWNQALKEIAGNVTMLRMTESIMKPGGWNRLTRIEKEKLLKNGIGQQDYTIMRNNIENFGQKEGNEWLPNTEAWTDATQRLKFRNALNQNVERIIVTPGAGDRALWTSTEMGSLLTQFKSYGQGAMTRMLTSGLQEKDGAFWQGAFLIVGLAAMVNEIKRAQYGLDSYESFDQKLINAIDRSGLLGWFTDVNNAIEKVSDYQLGMRPFLTDQQSYPVYTAAKASAVFGPSASAAINATNVLGDFATGNVDYRTGNDFRFIMPTGNLPYLDPIYDGVFGTGNVNRQENMNKE